MFVPNFKKIYGSQFTIIRPEKGFEKNKHYYCKVELTKYHLKALHQPSQQCASKINKPSTSSCIKKFIETELGCSPRIHGEDSFIGEKQYCNSSHQLISLAKISRQFQKSNEKTIYNVTGCLASCERDEYERSIITLTEHNSTEPSDMHIKFSFMDGSYEVKEEYLLYDYDSFIADVGGFMGLLLGCSIFSLYTELADLVVRFKAAVRIKRGILSVTGRDK